VVWGLALAGLVAGGLAGVATVSTIAAGQSPGAPHAVLDVAHLPPLLTVAGEARRLVYETYCLAAGVESAEERCSVSGTLYARSRGEATFRRIVLEETGGVRGGLGTDLPADLDGTSVLEYYAVFRSPDVETPVIAPPGGASAPSVSRRLDDPVDVELGAHVFGGARRSGERVAFARWGDGPHEVGLESGRNVHPIGAAAFDVDSSGSIALLDQVNRRMLRWAPRGSRVASRTPLSVNGTIGDIALAGDGSFYVLETTSLDGRPPLVRRFDDAGRELDAVESGERGPAQIRIGPDGPIVLQRPSHQWMPVAVGGIAAAPTTQRQRGRAGRLLRSGAEVVLLRHENELRVALLAGERVMRAWRITSATALGEVQLAEPLGSRFVVVVRVYDDRSDEFAVLLLDRRGLVSRTTVGSAEWAEGAPLGRFRLAGRTLYRLGSSPAGAFVDRFELEVR
jgi:hypothetical protein